MKTKCNILCVKMTVPKMNSTFKKKKKKNLQADEVRGLFKCFCDNLPAFPLIGIGGNQQ